MKQTLKIFENIHFASFQIDGTEISTYSSWDRFVNENNKVVFYNDQGTVNGFVRNAEVEIY